MENLNNELSKKEDLSILFEEVEIVKDVCVSLKINNETEYQNSGVILKRIKGLSKEIESVRKTLTVPLDIQKKQIMDFFREPEKQIKDAEGVLKTAISKYIEEKEKSQREIERKALKERERKEREIKEKMLNRAKELEEKGDLEGAAEIKKEIENIYIKSIPVQNVEAEKIEGVSSRENWKFRVIDESKVPREFLMIDEKQLDKLAKRQKEQLKLTA